MQAQAPRGKLWSATILWTIAIANSQYWLKDVDYDDYDQDRREDVSRTQQTPVPTISPEFRLLQEAVNASRLANAECPMLYSSVNGRCISFLSFAKVPWAEARQLCKSLMGELVWYEDLKTFLGTLDFMQKHQLTGDYWTGGRYDLDENTWAWVHNDSPMPRGVSFWTQRYHSNCKHRQLDANGNALPGSRCFNYALSPTRSEQGWCAKMSYDNYHLMHVEVCTQTLSPMCVLDKLANATEAAIKAV